MRRVTGIAIGLLVLAAGLLLSPLAPGNLVSHARPATTYAAGIRIVDSLTALAGPGISSECRSECFTHGGRTGRVIVLLHGLTNCPAQFDSLARLAFATGANVYVPRLPHHGFADRMTPELARLRAEELCAFTDRVLDAAHGLGDSVTVMGLSIGGVMAAWAGQERADVDRAVAIAPMIGWAGAPGPARTAALARLGGTLPNAFVWWDDQLKERLGGPRHVYPRFATRSVAACMQMGGATLARAAHRAPAARELVMITVGGDKAADNGAAAALVAAWRAHGARNVRTIEFPASLHLNHDIVDPEQVGARPAVSYPVLLAALAP